MTASVVTLVLAGWALMLFVPSIFVAALTSVGFGGAIACLFHIDQGRTGDLVGEILLVTPVAAGAVFVAWPFGMLFRLMVRKR